MYEELSKQMFPIQLPFLSEDAESQGTKRVVRKSDGMMFVVTQSKVIQVHKKKLLFVSE